MPGVPNSQQEELAAFGLRLDISATPGNRCFYSRKQKTKRILTSEKGTKKTPDVGGGVRLLLVLGAPCKDNATKRGKCQGLCLEQGKNKNDLQRAILCTHCICFYGPIVYDFFEKGERKCVTY